MATTGVINGTKFGVYAGGTKIGYATSASLSINHNLRDTSTKDSGGWRDQLEGQRDFEVSVEGMVIFATASGAISDLTVDELYTSYIASRTEFEIKFSTEVSGDYKWTGNAFMTSLSMDTPNEDSSTFSASFSGTGPLTQATV
jgi:predicted secreted protein|tara:strand:+ start:1406 stop:1834 length:429 start_codon:yes stop_codon:yes gene_type:complete